MDIAEINIKVNTQEAKSASKELDTLGRSGTSAQKNIDTLTTAAKYLATALTSTMRSTNQLSSNVLTLSRDLEQARSNTQSLQGNVTSLSNSFDGLKQVASALGIAVGFHEAAQAIKSSLNVIDDYKRTVIGIAATLTDTATGTSEQLKYIYKDNLAYAEETYNKVQLAASKFFASGKEMTEAWQILTNKGLRLSSDEDINNLGIIVDKIKLVTQGQSSSLQIAQELRSVLTGQARAGDQLAMLIEDRIGPGWKQVLNDHIRSGDVLAFVASQVKGVGVATEDIQNTLTSGLSTQKTLVEQIVNAGLPNMYSDVVKFIQLANSFLENQKSIIAQTLSMAYQILKAMAFTTPYARAVMSLGSAGQQQTGSNEIRQPVRNITIGGTLKYSDVVEQVKNALKREESFLKTPLTDQTKEITERYAKAFDAMRQSVSSGKLDQAGLASTGELWIKALKSEQVELDAVNKKLNAHHKSATNAANAAARYGEQTAGYLQQAKDQYNQLLAQWSGDTLGAKIAQIDKKYDQLTTTIRKGMIGAKGATTDAVKALEQLGSNRVLEKQIAQIEAWKKAMQEAASTTGRIGQLTGDPKAIYASQMTQAQLWKAEQDKRLLSISDDTERAKQAAEIDKIYALEEVNARIQAYEGLKGVSDEYWTAEKERIEANLSVVKENASSELAYKIYEAQQWEEYQKKYLENKQQNGTSQEAFKATIGLDFGSYKSDLTKAREEYVSFAKSFKTLSDDIFNAFSTGISSIVKGLAQGTLNMSDVWSTFLGNMGDAFMSFAMNILKTWWNNIINQMTSSLFQSATSSTATASSGGWLSSLFGFAQGGAFAGTTLTSNSILTSPTLFTTADSGFHMFASGGMGVAGEAGPEIIMPAVRMPSGNYGVRVQGDSTQQGQQAKSPVVNANTKVVNVLDPALVGQYLKTAEGEKTIVNVITRAGFKR